MLYVNKIASSLGGKAVLGTSIVSGNDLVNMVHKGLPADSASYILDTGVLSKKEFYWLVTSERTFIRRIKEKKLSSEESDKLMRFIRIRNFAVDVLGNEEEADAWLREKNGMLYDHCPLEFLDTDSGSQLVETLLGRIAHGIPS
jgi:putative toxin-antitoxin system antitoxin component (TIGR02293 family)